MPASNLAPSAGALSASSGVHNPHPTTIHTNTLLLRKPTPTHTGTRSTTCRCVTRTPTTGTQPRTLPPPRRPRRVSASAHLPHPRPPGPHDLDTSSGMSTPFALGPIGAAGCSHGRSAARAFAGAAQPVGSVKQIVPPRQGQRKIQATRPRRSQAQLRALDMCSVDAERVCRQRRTTSPLLPRLCRGDRGVTGDSRASSLSPPPPLSEPGDPERGGETLSDPAIVDCAGTHAATAAGWRHCD